ncbi:transcriptional regulator [Nocardioides baekrokdamisoli]|uniref:Transcriptional regulator n=1 Tax=Nocardioides baekrokdamisoli TaxID=1804624 RepID=A0A3G9IKC4_9ACTN|nr:MarR family transcriptional regulator [Nocardioides baekrokdamisoli]BBH18622.1 transcriptional regulator [Nocardioides baekrokdamisoli]
MTDVDPIAEAQRQWEAHGWREAAPGMTMVTQLVRVQQLLQGRIDAVLRPFNLSFARYEILRLLAFSRSGSMPMTRLGSLLQVHAASVTSAVTRLEAQGFAERVRDKDDRRIVRASITEKGRSVVDSATVQLNETVFEQPQLSEDQVAELSALLSTYRLATGDLPQ